MNKEIYFKEMKETTELIYNNLVELLKLEFPDKDLLNKILVLVKRRKDKSLARPFLIRIGYEISGGLNWKDTILSGIICEIENISTYQSNAAFDNKYGVADNELEKINQISAAFLTRNFIQKLINQEILKGDGKFGNISDLIYEIDFSNYLGQFYENNKLNAKDFNFNLEIVDYLKEYLRVKYLYGGVWIKNCLMIGARLAGKNDLEDELGKFGSLCGTPYTIINDISDFCVSNVERGFKISINDQFKDIWNGRVTLPIFYALSRYSSASKVEKNFLINCLNKKQEKTEESMKRVLGIMLKSNALNFTYSIMNFLRKKSKSKAKILPSSDKRDSLLILNSALRTNKFIHELRTYGLKLIDLPQDVTDFLNNFEANICVGSRGGSCNDLQSRRRWFESTPTLNTLMLITREIIIKTNQEFEFINITNKINDVLKESEIKSGFINIFSKHTTLAIKINEFEPLLLKDIFGLMKRIAPENIDYFHDQINLRKNTPENEPKNARGHLINMVSENSQLIPIENFKLTLGKWQQVFAIETSGPRTREVSIQIFGTK